MPRSNEKGDGLLCPQCGGRKLRVKDSRRSKNAVRRRRSCAACDTRLTTYEISTPTVDDENRLAVALRLYDKIRAVPEAQRTALFAMINAMATQPAPTFAPPLISALPAEP